MKVRMYVDLIVGVTHQSAQSYCYANSAPLQSITKGYRRYWFDLDFPPGTFAEERSTLLPTARASAMDEAAKDDE